VIEALALGRRLSLLLGLADRVMVCREYVRGEAGGGRRVACSVKKRGSTTGSGIRGTELMNEQFDADNSIGNNRYRLGIPGEGNGDSSLLPPRQ